MMIKQTTEKTSNNGIKSNTRFMINCNIANFPPGLTFQPKQRTASAGSSQVNYAEI
jgi:hypothetical protein